MRDFVECLALAIWTLAVAGFIGHVVGVQSTQEEAAKYGSGVYLNGDGKQFRGTFHWVVP